MFKVPELACIISFETIKHESGAPPVTAVFANLFVHAHGSCIHACIDKHRRQGIPKNLCPKQNLLHSVGVYFGPVSMHSLKNTSGWRKGDVMLKETLYVFFFFLDISSDNKL